MTPRPRDLPLPPDGLVAAKDAKAAIKTYLRIRDGAADIAGRVRQAERAVKEARAADVSALADAMRTGRADPGQARLADAENDLDAARRLQAAAAIALADATDAATLALLDDRAAIEAAVERRVQATAKKRAEALRALVDAQADHADALAGRAWLDRFPDAPKPGAAYDDVRALPGLRAVNGENYTLDAVITALRDALNASAAGGRPQPPLREPQPLQPSPLSGVVVP